MTPAARLAASIEILEELVRGAAPTRDVVAGYFRKRRYAGSGDRAAIREQVYATIRDLARVKWYVERAGGDTDRPRHWILADCVLAGADAAALFSGDRYAPAALDILERKIAASLSAQHDNGAAIPEAVRLGCPAWLEPSLRAALGDDFADELAALNEPAPVDLRVNTLRADRDQAIAALAASGIEAEPTPLSPIGLRLSGRPDLQHAPAFGDGLVEVQDEGSQMLARVTGAAHGERVVDYCAGAGGKTLALAAAMGGHGRIVACDIAAARLRRMTPRLTRAGVATMVELHDLSQGDGMPVPPGTADRVLVDAPCSATGTWRRHPFQRWRLHQRALAGLVAVQSDILDRAAKLVRPGGWLIYATCSLLGEENGDQISRFLAAHRDFARRPVAPFLPAGSKHHMLTSEGDLRLTPARHRTDGVYAAILEKGMA